MSNLLGLNLLDVVNLLLHIFLFHRGWMSNQGFEDEWGGVWTYWYFHLHGLDGSHLRLWLLDDLDLDRLMIHVDVAFYLWVLCCLGHCLRWLESLLMRLHMWVLIHCHGRKIVGLRWLGVVELLLLRHLLSGNEGILMHHHRVLLNLWLTILLIVLMLRSRLLHLRLWHLVRWDGFNFLELSWEWQDGLSFVLFKSVKYNINQVTKRVEFLERSTWIGISDNSRNTKIKTAEDDILTMVILDEGDYFSARLKCLDVFDVVVDSCVLVALLGVVEYFLKHCDVFEC